MYIYRKERQAVPGEVVQPSVIRGQQTSAVSYLSLTFSLFHLFPLRGWAINKAEISLILYIAGQVEDLLSSNKVEQGGSKWTCERAIGGKVVDGNSIEALAFLALLLTFVSAGAAGLRLSNDRTFLDLVLQKQQR